MQSFEDAGIHLFRQPLAAEDNRMLAVAVGDLLTPKPGTRAFALPARARDVLVGLASSLGGRPARLVRILAFDKTSEMNWGVPWHQDRTIAVKARRDMLGYGPWSIKRGVPHVEPPTALLEAVFTLQFHVDDCGSANGPLKTIPGSHKLGRLPVAAVRELAAFSEAMICTAQAGDVLAIKALTVHASDPAQSPRHRRILYVDFTTASLPAPLEWAIAASSSQH
jgi:ectoine hydroxylase-related dioxygenase (phytanoyl-CoA dioxygenase family)